jgi:hypothetical protein
MTIPQDQRHSDIWYITVYIMPPGKLDWCLLSPIKSFRRGKKWKIDTRSLLITG